MKGARLLLVVWLGVLCAVGAGSVPATAQSRESIKVHGDWVVAIKNADGTLAARHVFKNRLAGNGLVSGLLSGMLTRIGYYAEFRDLVVTNS